MRKTAVLSFLLILQLSFLWGQGKKLSNVYTISGHILDELSKETLIGASIFDAISKKGTVSNNYGFYSITLPAGAVELSGSYVGYSADTLRINLQKDTVINLLLTASTTLQEVVVEARQGAFSNVENTQLGAVRLSAKTINAVPAILGEVDLLKVLQLMPGVSSGTEGFSGMYVRGGNKDENLYLLDGNPLYDVNHLFGFVSAFNPDAIKTTEFYKGSFPARFGGRLSSVVDVRTKDGDMEEYHGNITIGLISAKAQVEGPIIKNKASFNVSFRRTYLDLLTTPALWIANSVSENEKNYGSYHFYDLNAKLNYKFSDRSRLYLNLYSGEDDFGVKQKWMYGSSYSENNAQLNWGNKLASVNWNYVFNPNLFGNMSLIYSKFGSDIKLTDEWRETEAGGTVTDESYWESHYNSGIQDIGYRVDFDYSPRPNHNIKFGSNYLYHTFLPEESGSNSRNQHDGIQPMGDTIHHGGEKLYAHELSVYAEDDINISSRLKANVGVNFSLFSVDQKTYVSLQPRVSTRFLITDDLSAKASYAMMNQYVHLLSLSSLSMPTDLWVPVTENIKPMLSHQFSTGLYYNLKKEYDISLEGYYKTMDNLIEYRDGSSMFASSVDWQKRVAMGNGRSYGGELMVQKTAGKITGWVGYSLSWSDRQFPGGEINNGNRYWAKYDNRHKINIVASYKIKKNMDINASWTYYTGNRMTVALESYDTAPIMPGNDVPSSGYGGGYFYTNNETPYYSSRNNYKLSDYHRLDLGFNFYRPKKSGNMGIWNVSIYNAYCRLNPMFAYPSQKPFVDAGGNTTFKPTMSEYSILPIIPSISYTYKF